MRGVKSGSVYAIAVSGSRVYVGGDFQSAGNNSAIKFVGYWDDAYTSWHPMAGSGVAPAFRINTIAVSDDGNNVYVGGENSFAKKWNSNGWSDLGTVSGTINAMKISGSYLYVGGSFTDGGGTGANGIARWNLTTSAWSRLATEPWYLQGVGNRIYGIGFDRSGQMYVCGVLSSSIGAKNINLWTGSAWSTTFPASNQPSGLYSSAYPTQGDCFAVDKPSGKIYVGGYFDRADGETGVNRVVQWNDFKPYTIVDLGTLDANTHAHGMAIKSDGEATGYSTAWANGSQRDHGFRGGVDASIIDLGGPWGTSDNVYPYGVNDGSIFVGTADYFGNGTLVRAFRNFLPGTWTLLDPIVGGTRSDAYAVNNAGVAVGISRNSPGYDRATRWAVGTTAASDLGSLVVGGDQTFSSYAYGINSGNYVVGKSRFSSGYTFFHAFRSSPNAGIDPLYDDLGTMGGNESIAYAINTARQIAGSSQDAAGIWRAFIKAPNSATGAGFTDLKAGAGSFAYGINTSGQVVGNANNSAFIWQSDAGFKTLQSLLPAGSQWVPVTAQAINDNGAIVGWGYNNAINAELIHAFIVKP